MNASGIDSSSCYTIFADKSLEDKIKIPNYYSLVFISLLAVASIAYFIKLKHNKIIYVYDIKSGIKEYLLLFYKFRSMYASIVFQLLDQASDISIINQLYLLSIEEKYYTNNDEFSVDICPHINVSVLFWLSAGIFMSHRFITTILIFKFSRHDICLTFLQIFDLVFLKTLEINYRFQNTSPCSPQLYLRNIEAMFEAFPQFVVQSYFLITLYVTKSDNFGISVVFALSTSLSFLSIIKKKFRQDQSLVRAKMAKIRL